jgi:signal transduction histidine kinase
VIPTVPFDLIFSVFVGLVFAACARVQFANGGSPWGRELAAVLSFEAIIVWPVALYFYLVHPAWSWMYLIDPARLPWGISVLVLLAYVATLLGGYLGGWALIRMQKEKLLFAALAVVGVGLVVFLIVARGRVSHAGTYDEYHAGHALNLGEGKLGWALAATSTGVAIAIVLVGFTLWEQGKRSRS